MKSNGAVLMMFGVLTVFGAFLINTSVPTYSVGLGMSEIANLERMHEQSLVVQIGLALFLGGCVLFGCGAVQERLSPASQTDSTEAQWTDEHEERFRRRRRTGLIIIAVIFGAFASLFWVAMGSEFSEVSDATANTADDNVAMDQSGVN